MDTIEINKMLRRCKITSKYYAGCFACDDPPTILKFPASLVLNTDNRRECGTHWTALFCINKSEVYYFDSFGDEPNPCIQKYLKKFKKVHKNKQIIQNILSENCGYYCIFFIYLCSKGLTFNQILKKLYLIEDADNYVKYFCLKML